MKKPRYTPEQVAFGPRRRMQAYVLPIACRSTIISGQSPT